MDGKLKPEIELGMTSTPFRSITLQNFQKGNAELSPVVGVVKKKKLIVLIIEAIKAVGDPKKGASYQAITRWVIGEQKNETKHFKTMLKLAFIKGISTGVLVRPSHCLTAVGATGSVKLPKEDIRKPTKISDKPSGKTASSQKLKKQTKEKPKLKVAEAAGKRALAKPIKKQNRVLSSSGSKKDEKLSKKTASKQISKKQKPAAENSPTKTALEKKDNLEGNAIDKAEKGKKVVNLKTKVKEGGTMEKIAKSKKLPKETDPGPSGQLDMNIKENRKTVVGGTKATGKKKINASKDAKNHKRENFSDTELEMKNPRPVPSKYPSDTELEISGRKDHKKTHNTAKERKLPGKRNVKKGLEK